MVATGAARPPTMPRADADLDVWYPAGYEPTMHALRLAAKHGTPARALDDLREKMAPLAAYPEALRPLERVERILRHWARYEEASRS